MNSSDIYWGYTKAGLKNTGRGRPCFASFFPRCFNKVFNSSGYMLDVVIGKIFVLRVSSCWHACMKFWYC